MNLVQQIDLDIKEAMLAREANRLRGLRAIKSAILLAQTEKGNSEPLSKETEIKILQKQIKQRKESIEIFEKQNREDLAKTEKEEIEVIEKYLPEALSTEEIESDLSGIVKTNSFSGLKDLGKLMILANKHFEGKADGKTISELGKKLLG
jgi:uncharacterized protein YqeY